MPTGRRNDTGAKNGGPGQNTRKSTAALMMSGTMEHDPGKYAGRLQEPSLGLKPIGDPPEYLNKLQKECWFEVLKVCHEGTVFDQDRFAVAEFAKVLAEMRGKKTTPSTYNRFFKFIALFGLSPADRSRVSVVPIDNESTNPFSGITQ